MRRSASALVAFGVALALGTLGAAFPAQVQAPYYTCTLTTTAATPCPIPGGNGNATVLVGFANNSATAQTATVTCYDNPAGATGPVAATIGPLGASQIVTWPLPGRPLGFGLTCSASAAIVGSGVEVYVR